MENINDSGETNNKIDVVWLDDVPIIDELPILPLHDIGNLSATQGSFGYHRLNQFILLMKP